MALAALIVFSLITNKRFKWDIVAEYLFDSRILAGLGLTLFLTVSCMIGAALLGTLLAVMVSARNPVLPWVARAYLWVFRGTPVLVQLLLWFNLAALYPRIGIPGSIFEWSTNDLITPLTAAIIGLTLNEAAYMAEIIRSGIQSVDEGQRDAGRAIGMTESKLMLRVVLPQAMRIVIPPTGNQVISMLKGTSLVSVLAISDLLYSAQIIYALNYQTIPLLLVACVWYLAMTSVLTAIQGRLEARYGKGFQPRRQVKVKKQKEAVA